MVRTYSDVHTVTCIQWEALAETLAMGCGLGGSRRCGGWLMISHCTHAHTHTCPIEPLAAPPRPTLIQAWQSTQGTSTRALVLLMRCERVALERGVEHLLVRVAASVRVALLKSLGLHPPRAAGWPVAMREESAFFWWRLRRLRQF